MSLISLLYFIANKYVYVILHPKMRRHYHGHKNSGIKMKCLISKKNCFHFTKNERVLLK